MAENTWKEDFHYNFSMRNQMISQIIDFAQAKSLLDLGCGNQDLRRFVPEGVKYTGYDLYKHCPSTLIKDFNNGDRVTDDADVAVCSGFIEYLRDPKAMIADICAHCDTVAGSYNFIDDVKKRSDIWVNALSRDELDGYFRESGFARRAEIFRGDDTVFAYARVSPFTPPLCINYLKYIHKNTKWLNFRYKALRMLTKLSPRFEARRLKAARAVQAEILKLTAERGAQNTKPHHG